MARNILQQQNHMLWKEKHVKVWGSIPGLDIYNFDLYKLPNTKLPKLQG